MKQWIIDNQYNLTLSVIIGAGVALFSVIFLDNLIPLDQVYIKALAIEFSKAFLMLILLKKLSYRSGLGFGAFTGLIFSCFEYITRFLAGSCVNPIFIILHILTTSIIGLLVAFVQKGERTFSVRLGVFLLLMLIIPVMASASLNQIYYLLVQGDRAAFCTDISGTIEQLEVVWGNITEFFELP